MASNALTNLRGKDPGANRQTDAISRLVEPVAKAVMATPIMGAPPPTWRPAKLGALFAPLSSVVVSSANWVVPRYHRDALGYVHVQAALTTAAGCASGSLVIDMPIGYRSSSGLIFCAESSAAFASLHLLPNGQLTVVQPLAAGSSLNFCIDYLSER